MSIKREWVTSSRQLASRVERYHTWPMITRQTVGQHTHRVMGIYCEIWGVPRPEVWFYMLHHDGGELSAGDIPFGGKKLSAELPQAHAEAEQVGLERQKIELPRITDVEYEKFKIADLMEMWETGVLEVNMGNQFAVCIVQDTQAAAAQRARDISEEQTLLRWIMAQGEEQ